jgi:hypothetical protein
MLTSNIKLGQLTYRFMLKFMMILILKELGMAFHCIVLSCGIELN